MKNIFRNIFIAASMVMIILSGSCKKESLSGMRQTTVNTPFDLQLSEKILVTSPNRQLTVELRSLNDGRCVNSPCEHAGNATARVLISDTDHHVEAETNLCLGMCDSTPKVSDTASITMDQIKYTVILKKIFGSPDKKAELQINRN